jgi:hypothetical protein
MTGLFNGTLAFILLALIEFFLLIRKGVTEFSLMFLNGEVLGIGALIFFVLGFVLGPEKMANLWGKIFRTNQPR